MNYPNREHLEEQTLQKIKDKQLIEMIKQYRDLRYEVEYYLKEFPYYNGTKAFEKLLKKHDEHSFEYETN